MMDKKKLKLKKGDVVYVRIPTNAEIVRVNQRYGYTLKTGDGMEYCFFDDSDVEKIQDTPSTQSKRSQHE